MWILKATVILYLTICGVFNTQGQQLENDGNQKDLVKFYVYTRLNPEAPEAIVADVESIIRNVINPSKPTTLAIHNMLGNKNTEEYALIINTKLQIEDGNVIIVDYSALIDPEDYVAAFGSAGIIAEAISDLVFELHNSFNMDLQKFHIVGYSFGGQLSGLVAQNVYQRSGEKVKRITALDPAGIIFTENTPANERLSPDDADYVEVIHTNAGQYGFLTPCGHADYYPNGGRVQPGCSNDDNECSHKRAYELIPEMWLPSKSQELLLLTCGNIDYMGLSYCRWQNEKMGDLEHNPTGLYYVETNDNKPFGKGAFKSEFW